MDKKWMTTYRLSDEYKKGVHNFLQFAFNHTKLDGVIPCPCVKCNNALLKTRDEVEEHLMVDGIVKSYTRWLYHGEVIIEGKIDHKVQVDKFDNMFGMIYDAAGPKVMDTIMQDSTHQKHDDYNTFEHGECSDEPYKIPNLGKEASKFFKLLEDAQQKLYPNCENFTKLSFIVKLFQIKCLYGISDKAITSLMQLFKEALPSGETLPKSFYEARKIIKDLGLDYEKIDTCTNDCMLFWKENAKLDQCLMCGESRWKSDDISKGDKIVAKKVLRYFPIKPRLQRLFMSSKTAKLGGPVQYRWMYPIERFLRKLKCYVRNKSRPEGSIAEGYIVEESLIFCSRYLHGIESKFNQVSRNSDGGDINLDGLSVVAQTGFSSSKSKAKCLDEYERKQAQLYILKNCEEVQPFLCEYEQIVHDTDFSDWFHHRAIQLHREGSAYISDESLSLARGPLSGVQQFMGYIINGFRFHTKKLEKKRINQNSGVLVKGVMGSKSVDYFGVLTEIVELQYLRGKRIVLFKCDWWDVDKIGKGVKIDKHGFVSINTSRKLVTDEPFVLASQAEQVFYVKDGSNPNWVIVLKSQSENFFDLPSKGLGSVDTMHTDEEAFQQNVSRSYHEFSISVEEDDNLLNLGRNNVKAFTGDVNLIDESLVEGDIESDPNTDDEDLLL